VILLRRLVLAAAAACVLWAAWIQLAGGVVISTSWLRLSSRDTVRPLAAATVLAALFVVCARRDWRSDVHALATPRSLAILLVVLTLALGLRWGSFVAGGSDASGYVSQAERWMRGSLVWLAPDWAREAPWQNAVWTSAPLGYRPLGFDDRIVPTYSPGLPLIMAGLETVAGRGAMYLAVPCLGALAILMTYLLGSGLAGPWAGVIGAALTLGTPTFLMFLFQPMSDVPVAAFWAVALWAASRPGAVGALIAGVATAAAILTRPNLVPLGVIVGLILLTKQGRRWRDLAVFFLPLLLAADFIADLNTAWYGSPFQSGYGNVRDIYAIGRVWPNLARYTGWWMTTQTPLALLALAAPFVVARAGAQRRVLILTSLAFPAAVLALYLPYLEFDVWSYLRFLLPAYPPVFAATGAVMIAIIRRSRRPVLAVAAVAMLVAAAVLHVARYPEAFYIARGDERYVRAAQYASALPPRSVFLSLVQSGSIHHYARRDVLRWELLEPGAIDQAVAFLRQRGHDVYVLGDGWEVDEFRRRYAGSETVRAMTRTIPATISGVEVYPLGGSMPPP
jgi:hypothetical protein